MRTRSVASTLPEEANGFQSTLDNHPVGAGPYLYHDSPIATVETITDLNRDSAVLDLSCLLDSHSTAHRRERVLIDTAVPRLPGMFAKLYRQGVDTYRNRSS